MYLRIEFYNRTSFPDKLRNWGHKSTKQLPAPPSPAAAVTGFWLGSSVYFDQDEWNNAAGEKKLLSIAARAYIRLKEEGVVIQDGQFFPETHIVAMDGYRQARRKPLNPDSVLYAVNALS